MTDSNTREDFMERARDMADGAMPATHEGEGINPSGTVDRDQPDAIAPGAVDDTTASAPGATNVGAGGGYGSASTEGEGAGGDSLP